ncbi:MAG: T9SS type A sorting domain-containing protein [Bacteroidetes bacterium]|nr:T9SS type A sorting domain-containing protein [Bacteroidota bacterium]
MKKTLLLLASIFLFCSVNAQNNRDRSKYNSQKPQYGFNENKGQIHDQNYKANHDVKYLLCLGNGMNVQLKSNSFSYDTYKTEVKEKEKEKDASQEKMRPNYVPDKDITYSFHRVDVELLGANANPQIIAEEPSADYLNFYNAVTPESGATFVRNYKKVTYKNIYNGIDMVFEAYPTNDKPIEYTFVVHPGADAKLIKLHYIGANQTELLENKINIEVTQGSFSESIPASWTKETNQIINVSYKKFDKNIFGFNIPVYPENLTLIIDPTPNLTWCTYFGGSSIDEAHSIKSDTLSNIYIGGITQSTNSIATSGAYQITFSGSTDGVIFKFDGSGIPKWATYFGGSDWDWLNDISIYNNSLYVVGTTTSVNSIATIGSHQQSLSGPYDSFLAKFDTTGSRIWSTYYGGNQNEDGTAVCNDSNGNIFIVGLTASSNAISTPGAFNISRTAPTNGFFVKFNSFGVRLWGSYYNNSSSILDMLVDNNSNISFTGRSLDQMDVIIARFDTNCQFIWSSSLVGNNQDWPSSITCDAIGNIFVTGQTQSTSGIATIGAFQTSFGGGWDDIFLTKFNNNNGNLIWSTYFGKSGLDESRGITVDINNDIILTGFSASDSMATVGAFQVVNNGGNDALLAKFDNNGGLIWSTYYGSYNSDQSFSVTTNKYNDIFIAGHSNSNTGIATPVVYQSTYGGGVTDIIIAKFSDCNLIGSASSISGSNIICQGQVVTYTVPPIDNATNYFWSLPNGAIGSSSTNSITVFFDTNAISGNISVYGYNPCSGNGANSSLPIIVNSVAVGVTLSGTTISADSTADAYQWINCNNGNLPIPGAINQSFTAISNGNYGVIITQGACFDTSACVEIKTVGIESFNSDNLSIFPNPVSNELIIDLKGNIEKTNFEILNSIGQIMYKGSLVGKTKINTSKFSAGIYIIKLENGKTFEFKKIVKE